MDYGTYGLLKNCATTDALVPAGEHLLQIVRIQIHTSSMLFSTHLAMDMPRFADVVVLPTPPFPEVITITLFSVDSAAASPSPSWY